MIKTVDRNTLQTRIGANPALVIIEALPQRYFEQEHIPAALNMPHDRVAELAHVLAPDRGAEIVVYCANASCQNSHIAAQRLAALGYRDISVYAGGKQDWREAGLALTAPAAPATA
jgi:rhodanese-related sulfurtransferase